MKLINSILYLEFFELVECGLSENYLRKAKSVGSNSWTFINDPNDGRKVLIQYESLRDKYKKMVIERFGSPYEYIAREPIKALVQKDYKAEEFYNSYQFNDKRLPLTHVKKYTIAASWLNMLLKVDSDARLIKQAIGIKQVSDFYAKVIDIIKTDNIDLPTSYRRIRERMARYSEGGYETLIDPQFGNKKAAKINDELCESVILEMCCNSNQHDDSTLCRTYNFWALANGYQPIVPATVGNWRRQNYWQIQQFREGRAAAYNIYGKQILRNRPSAPLLLVGSDDNVLDLYFRKETVNKKGAKAINYYHRFTLIVVMDAYNDYILGYAYGDQAVTELVKAAYLDAAHHIYALTGNWFLPHQIQADRWNHSALEPFFSSLAVYTPATARSPRGKYIEQAFGTGWHQELKFFDNYAGSNITSQKRINPDALELNKKSFPTVDEAPSVIEEFINRMRLKPFKNSELSRQQQWINAFNASELAQQRKVNDEKILITLGKEHDYKNTITNKGIQITIDGINRIYEVPEALYLQNVGKKVQVTYDPMDYSRILVSDGDKLRFVAYEFNRLPSAIADFKPGDGQRLAQLHQQKVRFMQTISDKKERRVEVLRDNGIDAQSMLQAGVLIKELRHQAENNYHNRIIDNYDPLDQM